VSLFRLLGHLAVRLGPLCPVVDADPRVCEEFPQDEHPGGVEGQVIIELGGHGLESGEPGPGDLGEVVVLVVVPNIEAEDVHEPIIGVRLIASIKRIKYSEKLVSPLTNNSKKKRKVYPGMKA